MLTLFLRRCRNLVWTIALAGICTAILPSPTYGNGCTPVGHPCCNLPTPTHHASYSWDISPVMDPVADLLSSLPNINASFDATVNLEATIGKECCTFDAGPSDYKQLNGGGSIDGTVDVQIAGLNYSFNNTWDGYGSINAAIVLGPNVEVTPSINVSVAGRKGNCSCLTMSGSVSSGIILSLDTTAEIELIIHTGWEWVDGSVAMNVGITGSASTSACASGSYATGSTCTDPPGTGFHGGSAGIGACTLNATLTFEVGYWDYSCGASYEVWEGTGSC